MLLKKIRQKGIKWFFWRLNNEFRFPTNERYPIMASIIDGSLRIRNKISGTRKANDEEELIYSIYDLKIAPITFDIIEFLIHSEYEANRLGKKGFVIVFVPVGSSQMKTDWAPEDNWAFYHSVYDSDYKLWAFHNIVLPITLLAPKCKGIYILPRRADIFEFIGKKPVIPELYDGINLRHIDVKELYNKINRPNLVEGLRASEQGKRYIKNWRSANKVNNPVVTITLRQTKFDKARNSNIKAYVKFAHYLQDSGYFPVVVPDTENTFSTADSFPGIYIFTECAWNMGLRMALYESAYLNYFSPNGPSRLAVWNSKVSYISMNSLPENSIVTTEEYYKIRDHQIGNNFKFALPNQRYVFTPESYHGIMQEFERFVDDDKKSRLEGN